MQETPHIVTQKSFTWREETKMYEHFKICSSEAEVRLRKHHTQFLDSITTQIASAKWQFLITSFFVKKKGHLIIFSTLTA
jgi:hypothetical protein